MLYHELIKLIGKEVGVGVGKQMFFGILKSVDFGKEVSYIEFEGGPLDFSWFDNENIYAVEDKKGTMKELEKFINKEVSIHNDDFNWWLYGTLKRISTNGEKGFVWFEGNNYLSKWYPIEEIRIKEYLFLNDIVDSECIRTDYVDLGKGSVSIEDIPEEENPLLENAQEFTEEMLSILKKKNHDYAAGDNPYKNFEMCEELGVTDAATGIVVRMCDKMSRVSTLIKSEAKVEDESLHDTLVDLANYALILDSYLKKDGNSNGTDRKD